MKVYIPQYINVNGIVFEGNPIIAASLTDAMSEVRLQIKYNRHLKFKSFK